MTMTKTPVWGSGGLPMTTQHPARVRAVLAAPLAHSCVRAPLLGASRRLRAGSRSTSTYFKLSPVTSSPSPTAAWS